MDRRTILTALGGLLATTAVVRAQTLGIPGVDQALGLGGDIVGAGLGVGGDIVGAGLGAPGAILGGDLGGGDGYRLTDLMGGEYSIQTSRLALRSRNPAIRDFAQLEIAEQVSVAAALGATPDSVPPRPDQIAIIQRLSAMRPGAHFDHQYVLGQINAHMALLANNKQAIQNDPNPAVRRVATLSVPTIQTHLAILDRLRAGLPAV